LMHGVRVPVSQAGLNLANLRARWSKLRPDTDRPRRQVAEDFRRINDAFAANLDRRRQQLAALSAQLETLNPQRTLERGYAIILDARGKTIRAPGDLRPRETITVRVAAGSAQVTIASVQPDLEQ
jgi:exodeoxyribonuclease VII large subunit